MPETILVVEDEPALRDTLLYNLKKDGFTAEAVGDGRAALPHWTPPASSGLTSSSSISCCPKLMASRWRASCARR
jgi:CheY-like chemotaxis protein